MEAGFWFFAVVHFYQCGVVYNLCVSDAVTVTPGELWEPRIKSSLAEGGREILIVGTFKTGLSKTCRSFSRKEIIVRLEEDLTKQEQTSGPDNRRGSNGGPKAFVLSP